MNPDTAAITEALVQRDIAAFVAGDWSRVAADFDEESFVGYRGATGPADWVLAYPTLTAYRDDWLRQAAELTSAHGPDLEEQLLAAQRVATVQVAEGRALATKVFDGVLTGPGGTTALDWVTQYFLRRGESGRWLITGFVGYLPRVRGSEDPAPRIRSGTEPQHATAGPYAPSVRVAAGPLVVISGQGPLDDAGALIGADIETQTAATLENCRRRLAAAGAGFGDVFKCTVYLADLDLWDRFNAVYRERVPEPFPVRTAVGTRLLLGMLVEIEMWAAP